MISYIKGRVIEVDNAAESIIVRVNDVGYELYVGQSILNSIKKDEIYEFFVYSSFSMYEGFKFYGFKDRKQLEIFKLFLNSIPNTGARKAMEYLNKILKSPSDFKKAIINRDIKLLKNLFGFTPKTSEKLIISLKDKELDFNENEKEDYTQYLSGNYYETVLNALINLGYKSSQANYVIKEVIQEIRGKKITIEDMIKLSLKKLSQV